MKLKYRIKTLEGLDESVQPLYRKDEDGSYILDVEGAVGKDRLDEFRNNNVLLQQQLDKLKDVDPAKYKELMEIERKVQEKELIEAGKVDEAVELRVKSLKEDLGGKVETLTQQLSTANGQLSMLMIDNVIKTCAVKQGVLPGAIDDVVLRAKTVYQMTNGKPVPMQEGKVVYGKDGETPMGPEEWMGQLKKTAPHLFQGFTGTGAGGGDRTGPVDTSKMSAVDKINIGLQQGGLMPTLPVTNG